MSLPIDGSSVRSASSATSLRNGFGYSATTRAALR